MVRRLTAREKFGEKICVNVFGLWVEIILLASMRYAACLSFETPLVDHGRSSNHQSLPYPVQSLQVQLVIRLGRDEAHVLAFYCFSNGLGIDEVVLVGFHKWLHKLGRNQLHLVALSPQRPTKEMRSGACLHPDQRHLKAEGKCPDTLCIDRSSI